MESQATCSSINNPITGPEVPFVPLLAGLTAWPVLRYVLEYVVRRVNPQLYEDLKMEPRKRYDLYFGTWLGSIFKVVSITACTAALFTTPAQTDIAGLVRPLNAAEQWCWGCRAVIYIQELPHISSIPELIIHHILSIVAMIGLLAFNMPRRQMYLAWASLVNEFVSNGRRLLKMHGRLTPRLAWWMTLINVSSLIIFRVTGCFVAVVWTLQGGSRGVALYVNTAAFLIYFIYMLRVSAGELSRAKLLAIDTDKPAKLVIAETWTVDLFGIVMGAALVSVELSALLIYEAASTERLVSEAEVYSIAWVSLQAVLIGLVGAYISAPILRWLVTKHDNERKTQRLSMHGGFLFAAATLLLSPTTADSVDKRTLLECMALSFPLLDAIGWIGCYYAGIGTGTRRQVLDYVLVPGASRKKDVGLKIVDLATVERLGEKNMTATTTTKTRPYTAARPPIIPLQLIASLLNGLCYVFLLALFLLGVTDLQHTAALATLLQCFIRHDIELCRKDVVIDSFEIPIIGTRVAWTDMLSMLQVCLAGLYMFHDEWLLLRRLSLVGDASVKPLFAECIGRMFKYCLSIGFSQLAAIFFILRMSRPASAAASSRRSSRRSEGGRAGSPGSPGSPGGKKQSGGGGGGGGSNTLRFIAVASTVGMCVLLGLAVYLGMMPEQVTSVEEVEMMRKPVTSRALWNAAWSWQFAVSTLGVAIIPAAVVQVVS